MRNDFRECDSDRLAVDRTTLAQKPDNFARRTHNKRGTLTQILLTRRPLFLLDVWLRRRAWGFFSRLLKT